MSPLMLGTTAPGGIPWVNYVNGRLLTGSDLRQEQESASAVRSLLARAGGNGTVTGLLVTRKDKTTVSVTAGMAINQSGQALSLDSDIAALSLAPPGSGVTPAQPGSFTSVTPPPAPPSALATGVYVLVMGPTESEEGSAQLSGQTTPDAGGAFDHRTESVSFRLVGPVDVGDAAQDARARNAVAYVFLATTDTEPGGLLAKLAAPAGGTTPSTIGQSEVPLAVVSWDSSAGGAIQFVDVWSVRRSISRPATDSMIAPLGGDGTVATGEAMILQFQDHVGDLGSAKPATDALGYFPPAGIVSIPEGQDAEAMTDTGGFFDGLTISGPFYLHASRVAAVVRNAYRFPPVDLAQKEAIWLYQVIAPPDPSATEPTKAGYVLFTTGHMSYQANGQYDLSYWNYADYALVAT